MAQIDFQIHTVNTMVPSVETLSGSGLGFFGTTQGSSVQIGAYQDTTNVSNADGSVIKDCYYWCCLCAEAISDDSPNDEEAPPPTLASVAPVATAVDLSRNMKIEMPHTIVEEGVTTPNGTTIKRRRLQI